MRVNSCWGDIMVDIGRRLFQYLGGAIAAVFTLVIIFSIVIALVARLYGIDLEPYILQTARLMSGGRLIDFEEAFVADASSGLRVCEVSRIDTDGDGFKEWLVYYQYDTVGPKSWKKPCPDSSPRAAAIYDNDRGEPAVLFPYKLEPPDSIYLGESGVRVEQHEIVANLAETTDPIPEIFIFGTGGNQRLTVFKYQQNTASWDSPTNSGFEPRYQVIGSFSGTGAITYNPDTKAVVVLDRGPFDRSQLAVKNVYALRGEGNNKSYLTEIGTASLAAPVQSTIDFAVNPPTDIFNAQYPEKILLAFYQALDPSIGRNWKPADLLAPESEAALKYKANDLSYFGLRNSGTISDLAVVKLQYFPEEEQKVFDAGDQTIEGLQPRYSRVEIIVSAKQNGESYTTPLIKFQMVYLNRQWKINRVLE